MQFFNSSVPQILHQGKSLEKKELEILVNQELIDQKSADVFQITSANVREIIRQCYLE